MKRTYPAYKDSGVECFGNIPIDWQIKRLKYTASCNDEVLAESTDHDHIIQYVDISSVDITNGIANIEEMTFEKAPSRARRKVQDGDTIISTVRTYLKAIASISSPSPNLIVSTGFAVIRPKPEAHSQYLAYQLKSQEFIDAVVANSEGVSYPAINASRLIELPIVLPPIDKQNFIASFLDRKTTEIDALIAKKRRMIELLQEKRTAIISHAVTKGLDPKAPMKDSGVEWLGEVPRHWKLLPLKHIGNIVLGKMLTNEDKGGSFLKPYLRAQNITWEKVDTNDVREMWFSVQELDQLRLTKNDLLISEGGEVGRAAIWNNELPECYIQNAVHKVTLKSCHNPLYYLYHSLIYGKGGYFDAIVNRVSIAHLTREKLKDVCFLAPPKKEQNRIISHIINEAAKIDLLIAKINDAIDKLLEYRTALISAAVTGKIDVRNEVRA